MGDISPLIAFVESREVVSRCGGLMIERKKVWVQDRKDQNTAAGNAGRGNSAASLISFAHDGIFVTYSAAGYII